MLESLALGAPSGLSAAIAKHSQFNCAPAKTHGFARTRRPNIDATTANGAPGIRHQVFPAIARMLESYARAKWQNPWVGCNETSADHSAACRSAPETIGG